MKLFHKMFLCFVVIFGIAFQTAGYLMIDFAYKNAIEQEKKFAFQEFQYNMYILQSMLYSKPELVKNMPANDASFKSNFTGLLALYGEDKECLFSNITVQPEIMDFNKGENSQISFQVYQTDKGSFIFVYDCIRQSGNTVYLLTETDISSTVTAQRKMINDFQNLYLVILGIGFPVIFLLTSLLTRPIKKVSRAAKRIAEGSYSERIKVEGQDEIGELAANFNQMAEKVEEKVAELSDTARQKEDFTANFAHELKTPLTSVIGYADMLYQRELPREQVKYAAEYILNEGMRLEALSLKLMDLFVLDKQDFVLEELSVREMFENVSQGMEPIKKKHRVDFYLELEQGSILGDYDLLKTMFLNLVDNAVKAGCTGVWINGKQMNEQYQISIRDNGTGIPKEEMGRITEAFYMADKSRSRKQHGAGLGLALVAKIVDIHHAQMQFESDGKSGTTVHLVFAESEGNDYE